MKKIILILAAFGLSFGATAQNSTLLEQQIQTATLALIKKGDDTLKQYMRLQPTATAQTAANATLTLIKKGTDTLNQTGRLQATAAAQVISTATLALIKKNNDTLAQYFRVNNSSLSSIKKGTDTLNQTGRLQATAAAQVISTATLALIKKGTDTINQNLRVLKVKLDSINQATKIMTYSFVAASSNTAAAAYAAGDVIGDDGRPIQCYSVTIGSGKWEITGAVMWLSVTSTGTTDINISVYTNTVTSGNDGDPYQPTTATNPLYLGTLNFGVRYPFTTSPIYSTREGTNARVGDGTIPVNTVTSNKLYFVLWANTAFTPEASQIYNVRLFLRKLN